MPRPLWQGFPNPFARPDASAALIGAQRSSVTQPSLGVTDKRLMERAWRLMDKVVRYCQQPQLKLKNSPPYILELLPEIYHTLKDIDEHYGDDLASLPDDGYLHLFLTSLIHKCQLVIKLFKGNRLEETMANSGSIPRTKLTRATLEFSHMAHELKTFFPITGSGIRYTQDFRITKHEASEWWKSKMGGKAIVTWDQFFEALHADFPSYTTKTTNRSRDAMSLQCSIDITSNNHISAFEWDVFTRLFHPWPQLLNNWYTLTVMHKAYTPVATYDDLKTKLRSCKDIPGIGTYMFRPSCTQLGQWAIGYINADHKIIQTIPSGKPLAQALAAGVRDGYYLYPGGCTENPDIKHLLEDLPPQEHIQVSELDNELYIKIGTSFELCKICVDRNKNIKIEPCGHLLCSPCLSDWQRRDGRECPFCRCEIKGTEQVVLDPVVNTIMDDVVEGSDDDDETMIESQLRTSTGLGLGDLEGAASTTVSASSTPATTVSSAISTPVSSSQYMSSVSPRIAPRVSRRASIESSVPVVPPPIPPRRQTGSKSGTSSDDSGDTDPLAILEAEGWNRADAQEALQVAELNIRIARKVLQTYKTSVNAVPQVSQ